MAVTDVSLDSSGTIAVGRYELTLSSRVGALVSPLTRYRRSSIAKRPMPRTTLPASQQLFGREREIKQLMSFATVPGAIEVVGPEGSGKSALLRRLLGVIDLSGFEAVLFIQAAGMPSTDLINEVFHSLYDVDGYTPTHAQVARYLAPRRALVLLDQFDGSAQTASMVADAMPGCTVIVASHGALLQGRPVIELGGLPMNDALLLAESASGEPLDAGNVAQMESVVEGVNGLPLDLLRAVSVSRAPREASDELLTHSKAALAEKRAIAPIAFAATNEPERCVLAAFVAVNGAALDPDAIEAISGRPDAGPIMANLAGRGLLDSDGHRVWVRAGDLALAFAASRDYDRFDEAFTFFQRIALHALDDRDRLKALSDAFCRVLTIALARERYQDVVYIGRPFADATLESALLGPCEIALRCVEEAASRLKDDASQSWALHQLGVLSMSMDDPEGALKPLRRALKMREKSKDAVAESVTRRALAQIESDAPEAAKRKLPLPKWLRVPAIVLPPWLDNYRAYHRPVLIAAGGLFAALFALSVARIVFPPPKPELPADVVLAQMQHRHAIAAHDAQPVKHASHPSTAAAAPVAAAPQEPQAPERAAAPVAAEPLVRPSRVVALAPQHHATARPKLPSHHAVKAAAIDPQIVSFDAEPQTISAGEYTQLCAYVRNADSVAIDYVGSVAVGQRSCVTVSPRRNQVYTLSATGNGKMYHAYATVAVQEATRGIEETPQDSGK
jgi:tetratricopeptide (TPR) repeat protein